MPIYRPFPIGLLPLMIAMPLMYWPRLLEGDTQPWVVIGALFACLFFWPKDRPTDSKRLFLPIIAAAGCALIYGLRETDGQYILRYVSIMITFIALWIIACRGGAYWIGKAIRAAIILWFAVGIYQLVAVRLGLPIEFFGRYIPGRGGVPSLTAEPSFYGSISVLQLMYLLNENEKSNRPYIVVAVCNVLLSGSILSYILLVVPLMRLPIKMILLGLLPIIFVVSQGFKLSDTGSFARLATLDPMTIVSDPMRVLKRDASTNLRTGHVLFSLGENFKDSILFRNSSSFREEYNNWAFRKGDYIYNGSDFILTSAGEMIFRSGAIGLILLIFIMFYGIKSAQTNRLRVEKISFMGLCFLSPVALSNPFFIFYILQTANDKAPLPMSESEVRV
jgi:hypothetical protein